MAQRLIDADELKNTIKNHDYIVRDRINSTGEGMFTVGIMQAIDEQPTIDALSVKHGKWIDYPIINGMKRCSECGVLSFGKSNYCPKCGARMDKE